MRLLTILILSFLLSSLIINKSNAQVSMQDSLALVALYNSTDGANWNNPTWDLNQPVSTWDGITVSGNRVTIVWIDGKGLSGPLPDQVGELTAVTHFYLYNNQLTGSIPSTIENMSSLRYLWLYNNQLTGSIPVGITNRTTLLQIRIGSNQLTGSIPTGIGNLVNLEQLDFQHNNLSGSIPTGIGFLTQLNILNFSDNDLTGTIPTQISSLSELTDLHLGGNLLTGFIPPGIGNLTSMRYLNLEGNNLSGQIPSTIGQLNLMEYLFLDYNNLSGPIPSEIGNLTACRNLGLQNNQLDGTITVNFNYMDNLEVMSIQNNNLQGDLPSSVAGLNSIQHIYMQNNQISSLPDLSALFTLQNLIVYDNFLDFADIEPNLGVASATFNYSPQSVAGETVDTTVNAGSNFSISVDVGGLNNVYQWFRGSTELSDENSNTLSFTSIQTDDEGTYRCEITNTVVTDLTLLSNPFNVTVVIPPFQRDSLALVALYNSTNGASWTPVTWNLNQPVSTWGGITITDQRVTAIVLNSNNINGVLPAEIGNLDSLISIAFWNNGLTGPLPSTIGNLENLEDIYLATNNLNGSIPREIGGLTSLTSLNMAGNNFTGSIPTEIGLLPNLFSIILPNNNLSGALPTEIGGLTTLRWLRISNNQFTGNIPGQIATLPNLEQVSLSNNQFTGSIPLAFFESSLLNELSMANNLLSGIIPNEISAMASLQVLSFEGNQLGGELPPGIGSLSNIQWLNISGNQFFGAIPTEFQNLNNLISLAVSENQFIDMPDLSSLPNINEIRMENNRFTFEDIEPNLSITSISYAPQDSVGNTVDTTLTIGEDLVLSIVVGGTSNQYQWFKNSTLISSANTNVLTISGVNTSDGGSYTCEITNSNATALTLISRPIIVIVQGLPISTTNQATGISTASATLNATVNPNGLSTTVEFVWGLNFDLSGATTVLADQSPIAGSSEVPVSSNISGLQSNTKYYFQVKATNSLGFSWGLVDSFTTLLAGSPPTVTTLDANSIITTDAILNGTVNPNGLETTVEFEFNAGPASIPADQSPISGTNNQNVAAQASGLTPNTQYQYRVNATNSAGTTNGDWVIFFTLPVAGISVTTSPAEEITDTEATLRGTINPDNQTLDTYFDWGLDVSYGTRIPTDLGIINGNSNIIVTANLTTLAENTTYHYRVLAFNGDEEIFGQDLSFNTLYGPVTLNNPANGAIDIGINSTLSWDAAPNAIQYQIQVATDVSFNNLIIDETTNQVSYNVTLSFGTPFYWRVTVFENNVIQTWSDIWSFATEEFPEQIPASTSLVFESKADKSDYLATDYRLFGLPGDPDLPLTNIFGSQSGDQWIAYWDNGQSGGAENYLISYSQNETFRFKTGRAFWIIYNGQLQIDQMIGNSTINVNNEIIIPLHPGWNMITNPLTTTINWPDIQTYNSITEPLHSFNGSFTTTTNMETYRGYYYFNDPALSTNTLIIPAALYINQSVKEETSFLWQTSISVKTEDQISSTIQFGVSESALNDKDIHDYHKPRAMENIPGIYFERPKWDDQYPVFASDIRTNNNELKNWAFKTNSGGRKNLQISLDQMKNIPEDLEIYLVDFTRKRFIDLREKNIYSISGSPGLSSFEILVGEKESVNQELRDILPKEFSMEACYPNPFNPQTTIPISLPEKAELKLVIYDLLGRMVKNIHSGALEPGKHFFTWDGTNETGNRVSSGIYLLRADNNKNIYTGKLILLK